MDILSYVSAKLFKKYDIPEMADIFNSTEKQYDISPVQNFIENTSYSLKAQLNNFNIDAKIVNVNIGPVVIRYEMELAPGVSIKKFSKLSDDLAITFKTHSIRIVAPIPGTSLVGIEIPNPYATIIPISDILRNDKFLDSGMILPVALAKTTEGTPFVIDITKAPHLLIAGCTGSGKSVCTNTIISSLLMTKSPTELKLVLIDPKIVEMQPYSKIPHLLRPVVTDPKEAIDTFEFLVEEIDSRFRKLASAGARNIEAYNKTVNERMALPYIVAMVDEFSDLILSVGDKIEEPIVKIAQKARAAGIHLILATQRPSVKVITGLIKANFPTRIAFKTASQVDSKIIIDKIGAEKLLGNGDMLFVGQGISEPIRLHGSYIKDEEINRIVNKITN